MIKINNKLILLIINYIKNKKFEKLNIYVK